MTTAEPLTLMAPDGTLTGHEHGLSPDELDHCYRTMQRVRDPRCSYERSLETLRGARRLAPGVFTKSSLMLGLGESHEEVL